jgi:hypothetical protein
MFILEALAPSPEDQAAGFEFSVSWNDASPVDTFTGLSGLQVEHVFAKTGNYIVKITAMDQDGVVSDVATHVITISAVAMQDDPLYPGDEMLVVGGTLGGDTIVVNSSGGINVRINGKVMGVFRPTSRIVVYGQDGNDHINLAPLKNFGGQVIVRGGDGNDTIIGGGSSNVLLGEAGDDHIIGGSGRDILIGGQGADKLQGNNGDDVLIAGTTVFDNDDAALSAIFAEWISGRKYSIRVKNISGKDPADDRLNADFFLTKDGTFPTVLEDDQSDFVQGGGGQNWVFYDRLKDRLAGNGGEGEDKAASGDSARFDVNGDGYTSPLDALLIINDLNRGNPSGLFDVSGDGYTSPLDVLMVINYLNGGGSGEGESPATIADAAPTSWIFVANSKMHEPGAGDVSDEVKPVGVKVTSSGPSMSFLQSLDLLFAKLDESEATKTREPYAGRRETSTGDLDEFLDSMLNGVAEEEELFTTAAL